VQRRQVGLRRKNCLVLQFVLVYICQNRRRTGIWIVGLVDALVPGVAGRVPQQPELRRLNWLASAKDRKKEPARASKQIQLGP